MNVPDKKIFIDQMLNLNIDSALSYVRVYPAFLSFFRERKVISRDDFVIGANFTYAWMPTILDLNGDDRHWDFLAELLTQAKAKRITDKKKLAFLARIINNSLVGASKLLHFANPREHAIWDSRVYFYLNNEKGYAYRMNKEDNYINYLTICEQISGWEGVPDAVTSISNKLGYQVTPFRAIELTMFVNGKD